VSFKLSWFYAVLVALGLFWPPFASYSAFARSFLCVLPMFASAVVTTAVRSFRPA
jgi:hypothetical protein